MPTEADQETVACESPRTAVTVVGAAGVTSGVTIAPVSVPESALDTIGPEPSALVATTLNRYAVPFVSAFTTHDSAVVVTQVLPSGDDVTVYPVIGEPPVEGANQLTVAWAFPATTARPLGAPGVVAGVTAIEARDTTELPAEFVAIAVKV